MSRTGMATILGIGSFGLVALLILFQQALERGYELDSLIELKQEIEQTYDLDHVRVTRKPASDEPSTGDPSEKRHWIRIEIRAASDSMDDTQTARAILEQAERTYDGNRDRVLGFRLEYRERNGKSEPELIVEKPRGPAPVNVIRPSNPDQ